MKTNNVSYKEMMKNESLLECIENIENGNEKEKTN